MESGRILSRELGRALRRHHSPLLDYNAKEDPEWALEAITTYHIRLRGPVAPALGARGSVGVHFKAGIDLGKAVELRQGPVGRATSWSSRTSGPSTVVARQILRIKPALARAGLAVWRVRRSPDVRTSSTNWRMPKKQ